MRTVVGVFPSRAAAYNVARDLTAVGIPQEEVIVTAGEKSNLREWSEGNIAAGASSGYGWFWAALIPKLAAANRRTAIRLGALFGGSIGIVVGLIAIAAESGRAIVIGHEIVTVLGGLVIGAIGGGIVAGVYNAGVSHEMVPLSEEALRERGVVVAAHVDEPAEEKVLRVMNQHGARQLRAESDAWAASGSAADHSEEELYPSDSSVRKHPFPEE
jgi:uncharacterized membrane protein